MFQRKMRQPSAAGQREALVQRPQLERRPHGKQGLGKQVLPDRPQILRQPVERDPPQRMDRITLNRYVSPMT